MTAGTVTAGTVTAGTVAAVVVRWRGGDEVDCCLESLLNHGGDRLREVVLVDSGSGDGGAERLARAFPGVTVLALAENRSFAWAANQGCAGTRAPLLLLLNPDTQLQAESLPLLCEHLDSHSHLAGVVPLLIAADGSSQHRWQLRRLPSVPRLALGLAGAPAFRQVPDKPVPVDQPAAAAWLLRREVWQALGGLDPAFAPAWWEDVDFCERLHQGLRRSSLPAREGFRLVPEARIKHLGGSSLASLTNAEFLTFYFRNLLHYARRYRPWQVRLISTGARLSLLLRALGRPRRRGEYLTAFRSLNSKGQ